MSNFLDTEISEITISADDEHVPVVVEVTDETAVELTISQDVIDVVQVVVTDVAELPVIVETVVDVIDVTVMPDPSPTPEIIEVVTGMPGPTGPTGPAGPAGTGGGGGGAATLDELTDVATAGVGDGYVLTHDLASGQWVPRPGGGAVGSWENDQIVTFTAGTPVEEVVSDVVVAGASYPVQPHTTFTVTQAMLASANKPVGFAQYLLVYLTFDAAAMTGGANTTISTEASYGGEVIAVTNSVSTTANAKIAQTIALRDAQVGDVVTFRSRLGGAAFGNVPLTWRAAVCYPLQLLSASVPSGGRWVYNNLVTGSLLSAPGVASRGHVIQSQNWKFYDDGLPFPGGQASTATGPETFQSRNNMWVPRPTWGLYASATYTSETARLVGNGQTAANTAPQWTVMHPRVPSTIQFDRLAIPQIPV